MSTFADTSQSQRLMDIIGVTPLPPATNSILGGILPGCRANLPFGPLLSILSPTFTLSGNQFETSPPGTRLTVISRIYGRDGVEEMVYERTTFLPSMLSTREQYCPGQ